MRRMVQHGQPCLAQPDRPHQWDLLLPVQRHQRVLISRYHPLYSDCFAGLENCHDAFENFMTGSGRIVGFGCLIAVLVCLLNIVAVCCICYHPTRVGGNRSNFYSRMIEMD